MRAIPSHHNLIVIGGGAAGFFGAITAGEAGLDNILIMERGPEVLTKVRISGGGRCNVTHECFDPRELVQNYPRGMKNLIGPFHRFQPADTIHWFQDHGVQLKTESDGRMFPVTDNSGTIITCLTDAARKAGARWRTHCGVAGVRREGSLFIIETDTGELFQSPFLLVATGGIRGRHARIPVEDLSHSLEPPVPSLFTFKIDNPLLQDLQGVAVPNAVVRSGTVETSGPLLITHWGLSGPAILKASAWGARELAELDYKFPVEVNWCGSEDTDSLRSLFAEQRQSHGSRRIMTRCPVKDLTRRLWQRLAQTAGISEETTWSVLTRGQVDRLVESIIRSQFQVEGKSLNKEEFVTCGGVSLDQIKLKTMESKSQPGLYFAGEVLNVDGVTGGFNFQSAWTTAHLAGLDIAGKFPGLS